MEQFEILKHIEDAAEAKVSGFKAKQEQFLKERKHLDDWLKLKQILSVEYGEDLPSGDIIITVRRHKFIASAKSEITHDVCEFKP